MDRRIIVVIVVGIALVTLVAGAFYVLTMPPKKDDGALADPFAPSIGGSPSPGGTASPFVITLEDGTRVQVPDFTDEQPEWVTPESGYQVAGSEHDPYHILYFPDGSGFLISIFEEPIGEVRLAAQSELREKLQLGNEELCRLSIDVVVSDEANETYSGRDLGLSFCPGATMLP